MDKKGKKKKKRKLIPRFKGKPQVQLGSLSPLPAR